MVITEHSLWRDDVPKRTPRTLRGAHTVDIAIIGGGITGCAAAYLLRDSGFSVALIDKETIGSWSTGSTTAFLMSILDIEPSALIERFGDTAAANIVRAHRDAIDWYESVVREEHIDCEFMRCNTHVYAKSAHEAQQLRQEVDASRKLGLDTSFRAEIDGLKTHGAIRADSQAKFHPLKFLHGLVGTLNQETVFENTDVTRIEERSDTVHIYSSGGTVTAKRVLMATHYPLDPQPPALRFKKAWYQTYVLAASIPKGAVPEGLYEDVENPYHYMRIDSRKDRDRLILGGEDHRSDIPFSKETAFAALEQYMHEVFAFTEYTITHQWSGGIVEPGDGIAFIGPIGSGNIFYSTGYSGNGMTYGVIAAKMFREFCTGKPSSYPEFAADRPLSLQTYAPSALEYIQELINGTISKLTRRK
jgi:glycine/D-amino acid oxidase-like deaminating enzyme